MILIEKATVAGGTEQSAHFRNPENTDSKEYKKWVNANFSLPQTEVLGGTGS